MAAEVALRRAWHTICEECGEREAWSSQAEAQWAARVHNAHYHHPEAAGGGDSDGD